MSTVPGSLPWSISPWSASRRRSSFFADIPTWSAGACASGTPTSARTAVTASMRPSKTAPSIDRLMIGSSRWLTLAIFRGHSRDDRSFKECRMLVRAFSAKGRGWRCRALCRPCSLVCTLSSWSSTARRRCSGWARLLLNLDRERDEKRRALPQLRVQPDSAALHLDNSLRDREPKSGAALLAGDRVVGLLAVLEQFGLLGRGNARTGVAHRKIVWSVDGR